MTCPNCAAEISETANFCETCGTRITSGEITPSAVVVTGGCRCGAGPEQIDAQGFCQQCGRKAASPARQPQLRDHIEREMGPNFAGVTDRGRKHSRNEDALALAVGRAEGQTASFFVVCDGVSTSQEPDKASEAAAQAALEILGDSLLYGVPNPAEIMQKAIAEAHKVVCAVPHTKAEDKDPPLTTIVAAFVRNHAVTVGWVGDSRAYLLTETETRQLTHDHSWQNQVVDSGEMTQEAAEQSPNAHAITLCLGLWEDGTAEESPQPGIVTTTLPAGSRLLLCTDGLWNYAPTAAQIAALVADTHAPETALELSRRLTAFANLQGGRDNITVAVLTL